MGKVGRKDSGDSPFASIAGSTETDASVCTASKRAGEGAAGE